jgi:hypothetical protein
LKSIESIQRAVLGRGRAKGQSFAVFHQRQKDHECRRDTIEDQPQLIQSLLIKRIGAFRRTVNDIRRVVGRADDLDDGFALKPVPRLTGVRLQLGKLRLQDGIGYACHRQIQRSFELLGQSAWWKSGSGGPAGHSIYSCMRT